MRKKIIIEPWRIFWAGACSITSLAPSKKSGSKFSKTFRLLSISSKIPTTRYFFEILSFALSRAHLDRSEHFLSCPQKYGTTCHHGLVHSYKRLKKYLTLASVRCESFKWLNLIHSFPPFGNTFVYSFMFLKQSQNIFRFSFVKALKYQILNYLLAFDDRLWSQFGSFEVKLGHIKPKMMNSWISFYLLHFFLHPLAGCWRRGTWKEQTIKKMN